MRYISRKSIISNRSIRIRCRSNLNENLCLWRYESIQHFREIKSFYENFYIFLENFQFIREQLNINIRNELKG